MCPPRLFEQRRRRGLCLLFLLRPFVSNTTCSKFYRPCEHWCSNRNCYHTDSAWINQRLTWAADATAPDASHWHCLRPHLPSSQAWQSWCNKMFLQQPSCRQLQTSKMTSPASSFGFDDLCIQEDQNSILRSQNRCTCLLFLLLAPCCTASAGLLSANNKQRCPRRELEGKLALWLLHSSGHSWSLPYLYTQPHETLHASEPRLLT